MNLAQTYLGEKFLQTTLSYILNKPERNLPALLTLAEKAARDPNHKKNVEAMKRIIQDEENVWYKYALRVLNQAHPNVKRKVLVNFFLNASLLGVPKQNEVAKRLGVSVPFTILVDPTERCNLNCTGCWAGDYQRRKELSYETLDRLFTEAEELGIYLIILSGGEPLMRKKDIIALADKHRDQVFHIFTNGTLIDDDFVEDVQRVGNITFAISIEGFEQTTDERRGKGVFKKVINAMETLKEAGIMYGFSATYTRKNTEELGSDEFVDLMIDKGNILGWFFTYIPVGKDVDLDFMATPEQRAYMFDKMKHWRKTKPIFMIDFWNDGEGSYGCIAGGRRYLHINAHGDVEPCAFVHFATTNIEESTLKEALCSPLMKAYQKRQPFNRNLLRPCPLIDNPEALREIIHESGAYCTQLTSDESVDEYVSKISGYSEDWGKIADDIWNEHHPCACERKVASAD